MVQSCTFRPATVKDSQDIIRMSQAWAEEGIVHGLCADTENDLKNADVWICLCEDKAIGYILGSVHRDEHLCVFPSRADYFEVDEFYIDPGHRSQGTGGAFYAYVEDALKKRGIKNILLSSATKDFMRTMNFYTKNGFSIWNVTYYKNLDD